MARHASVLPVSGKKRADGCGGSDRSLTFLTDYVRTKKSGRRTERNIDFEVIVNDVRIDVQKKPGHH